MPNTVPVETKFNVNSIHGSNQISSKCYLSIFGVESQFFLLPQLATFDGIIGLDLLTTVNAVINLRSSQLSTDAGVETMEFVSCANVNFAHVNKPNIPPSVEDKFDKIIEKRRSVFSNPDESLPYNTNVVATIRTVDNEPVYSKLYPYPPGVTDFVNKEVDELLRQGIIQPSRSPYNNPIWVVDKKGIDENGNKKKTTCY